MQLNSRTLKSATLASGKFLSAIVGVASAAILARVLTKQDFATFTQSVLAYLFILPFLALGLPRALYFFLPGETERPRGLLTENLLLLTLMGGVFSLFLYLGGNHLLANQFNNPHLADTLQLLAPYSLFALPALALATCLTARDKVQWVAIYNVLSRVVIFIAVATPVLIWRTPESAILGMVVGAFLVLLPAIRLMYKACDTGPWQPINESMWQQIKIGLPMAASSALGALQVQMDKLFVASMCTTEEFAVFAIGAQQLPVVSVITTSITSITLVDMTRFLKEGQKDSAIRLWQSALIKAAVIIMPILCFCFFAAPDLIPLIFSDTYKESVLPFQLYLLLIILRMTNYGNVALAGGKPHYVTLVLTVTVVANVIFNWLLIPRFGYIGAVIGTLLTSYLIEIPMHMLVLYRGLGIWLLKSFAVMRFLKVAGCGLFASAAFLTAPLLPDLPIVRLAVQGTVFGGLLLIAYRFTGVFEILNLKAQLAGLLGKKAQRKETES